MWMRRNNWRGRYAFGDGIPQNDAEARFWYSRAADSGDTATQIGLASLYYDGRGVVQNYGQAFIWFNRAAKAGDARALSYLAVMYDKGLGVPTDAAKARENYRAAADKGVDFAAFNAAVMCRDGVGGAVDLPCAAKYFGQAANAGMSEAEYEYALALRDGRGVGKNLTEAAMSMGKSASAGYVPAFYPYGLMLESGTGLAKSDSDAFTWFTRAVTAKSSDTPAAYYEISLMYRDGRGVDADLRKFLGYSDIAAKGGIGIAALDLGNRYLLGNDVNRDPKLALNYFTLAAKSVGADDASKSIRAEANYHLGIMYRDGDGVGSDFDKAASFFAASARFGNIKAKSALIDLAEQGNNIAKIYTSPLDSPLRLKKWWIHGRAYSSSRDDDGSLILSAGMNGVSHLRNDGSIEQLLGHDDLYNLKVDDARISIYPCSAFRDVDGTLIVASDDGSVIKIATINGKFSIKILIKGNIANNRRQENCSAFRDKNGSLIVTSYDKVVSLTKYGAIDTLLTDKQIDGQPRSAFRDENGSLIVSIGIDGVVSLDADGHVTPLLTRRQMKPLKSTAIYALRDDANGDLIVATRGGWEYRSYGAGVFRLSSDGCITTLVKGEEIWGNSVFRDVDGALIITGDGLVVRYYDFQVK